MPEDCCPVVSYRPQDSNFPKFASSVYPFEFESPGFTLLNSVPGQLLPDEYRTIVPDGVTYQSVRTASSPVTNVFTGLAGGMPEVQGGQYDRTTGDFTFLRVTGSDTAGGNGAAVTFNKEAVKHPKPGTRRPAPIHVTMQSRTFF